MILVLDSYALLAFLEGESGAVRVADILESARRNEQSVVMSLINLGEVLYIVERENGLFAAQETLAVIQQLPIRILEPDRQQVLAAAHIKANYPLSYADAFAVAATQSLEGVLITGDPEFHSVEELIQVEWLP